MRTTIDIDSPVLADLRRLGRARRMPMGRLASELLGRVLREATEDRASPAKFVWVTKPMDAKVDLADRNALYDAMEGEGKA